MQFNLETVSRTLSAPDLVRILLDLRKKNAYAFTDEPKLSGKIEKNMFMITRFISSKD